MSVIINDLIYSIGDELEVHGSGVYQIVSIDRERKCVVTEKKSELGITTILTFKYDEDFEFEIGEEVYCPKGVGTIVKFNHNGKYILVNTSFGLHNYLPTDIQKRDPDPLMQLLNDQKESITSLKEFVKDGKVKSRMSLIPQEAIIKVADVFTHGAEKYNEYNFSKGARTTTYIDASLRHINRYLLNENDDQESGLPHLAHAISNLLMLLDNDLIGTTIENRNSHYNVNRIDTINGAQRSNFNRE